MDTNLAADPAVIPQRPERAVFEIKQYMDDQGRGLTVKLAQPPAGMIALPVPYEYSCVHQVPLRTPNGPMPIEVEVVLDNVSDVFDAFAKMDEQVRAKLPGLVQQRVEQLRAHAQRAMLAQGAGVPIPPAPRSV